MFLFRVRWSALRQLLVLVLFFPRLVVNPSSLSRPRFRREVFARLRVVVQQVSHTRILLFLDFVGIVSFRLRRRRRKVVLLHVSFQTINAMMVLRNKT